MLGVQLVCPPCVQSGETDEDVARPQLDRHQEDSDVVYSSRSNIVAPLVLIEKASGQPLGAATVAGT